MKLLVAIDGSESALDAARHALRLRGAGLQAEFVLATVQEPIYAYEMLAPRFDISERVSGAVETRALEGAEALFRAAGVPFVCEIGSGDPAQTLVEIAGRHGCDGIVLGARGLGTMRSVLLGSVSQAVLHASMVPVTVVRHVAKEVGA